MSFKFDFKKYFPLIIGIVGIAVVLFAGSIDKRASPTSEKVDGEDLSAYTEMLEEKGCTDGHTVNIYGFEFDFVK